MKIACIKFLYDVVSSLHMHYADWTNVIVQISYLNLP